MAKKKVEDHTDVIEALNQIGHFDASDIRERARLEALFGERFALGWTDANEGRVKKYIFKPSGRVQWIVVGKGREYIIYPDAGYCHCEDFFFQVMEGEAYACQHLIAQKIADTLRIYDLVEETDEHFETFMEEWRKVEGSEKVKK